jgi:hypothetical protein
MLETREAQKTAIEEYKKEKVKKLAKRSSRIAQIIPTNVESGGSELTDIGLTDLANAIFGENYVDELKKNEIIRSVRDIWELSTPTTQCENIIGRVEPGKTPCWICSLPINDTYGLTAECEHVLPIAQSVIYIGLYSTAAAKGIFPRDMTMLGGVSKEHLVREYKWAHQVCNQVKNDESYLDFNLKEQNYFVREDKIANLLQRIKTNSRSDGTAIKPLLTADAVRTATTNAIRVFQEVCDFLNGYKAPRLLELAGLISAGYGPRKASVNPRWEKNVASISQEELEANMRKEIIKANIEYSGVAQKTLEKLSNLPRIGKHAGPVFLKIVENRRPEYVSLFMRIKPTQTNMNHLIAYIRQQLFSEFAAVDASTLGIAPTRRSDANTEFRKIISPLVSSMNVAISAEFNEELMKANKLYQNDTTIGDTIRKILIDYTREGSSDLSGENISQLQADIISEIKETSGDSEPINPASEYVEMIKDIKPIYTKAISDVGTIASDPTGAWVDNSDGLVDSLNSTEQWTADEKDVAGILANFSLRNFSGGNRRNSRRKKRTRKLRYRRV